MKKIFFAVFFLSLLRPSHSQSRRFSADDLPKIVRITDPQISADGKTVAVVVGRANMSEDRWDSEIEVVDIATGESRVMTHEQGVSSPRWSPGGDRLAYLAQDVHQKSQIFVLHSTGGNSTQVTHSRTSVSLLAWKPDGSALAFAAADEEPERKGDSRFEDAFEVGNNNYLERSRALPVHIWLMPATGGDARKLTSGEWSLPRLLAPTTSSSQISFTPDGRQIVFVKAITPISGDSDSSRVQLLDLTSGAIRALKPGKAEQVNPVPSPDGSRFAYLSPKNGKIRNVMEVFVAQVAEGAVKDATADLDRNVESAAWMPDGRSLLVAANDDTQVSYWVQPIDGKAKKIQIGKLTPSTTAVTVAKDGGIAFTATSKSDPAELFYIAHIGDTPKQLTHLQTVTDGMELGRIETRPLEK